MKKTGIAGRSLFGMMMIALAVGEAGAAENGNTQYSPGSAQFFAAGIPPFPGLYFLSQTSYFHSDRLNNGSGDKIPIDFKVSAIAETMRFLYVSNLDIGGAKVWGQVVVPLVNLDMTLPIGNDTRFGLADVSGTLGLVWHKDKHSFVAGVDVAAPTGLYDSSKFANIGVNHWSVQPTLGYHYTDPQGLEVASTLRFIFNTENNDTKYTSGNEMVIDYAVGWNFDKLKIGAVGYYLQQLTDDSGPAAAADGHRGKGFAIGPSVTYAFNPGLQFSGSWQHDVIAENRAQGDTFWFNFATKF